VRHQQGIGGTYHALMLYVFEAFFRRLQTSLAEAIATDGGAALVVRNTVSSGVSTAPTTTTTTKTTLTSSRWWCGQAVLAVASEIVALLRSLARAHGDEWSVRVRARIASALQPIVSTTSSSSAIGTISATRALGALAVVGGFVEPLVSCVLSMCAHDVSIIAYWCAGASACHRRSRARARRAS
jgi:hypothetical protein